MDNISRTGSSYGLKKIAVVTLVSLIASFILPLQALASHSESQFSIDYDSMVKAGPAGGTALRLYFSIKNSEAGAGSVSRPPLVYLEVRSRTHNDCSFFDGVLVKRIINGASMNPGFFYGPYVWDGKTDAGNFAEQEQPYCFSLRAFDPFSRTYLSPTPYYGTINLFRSSGNPVPPPTPKVVPIDNILSHNVSGSPLSVPGNVSVNYTALQTIRSGLIFRISNAAGAIANTQTRSGVVLPDSMGTFTWNGKNSAGANVAPGNYSYSIVTIDGGEKVLGQGSIVISAPPLQTVSISSVSANPASFSPALSQSSTISYTLDQPARVKVEIYSGNSLHRTLVSMPNSGAANNGSQGINSVLWNGYSSIFNDLLNLVQDNGSYEIRVTAVGENGVTTTRNGTVSINNATAPPSIGIQNVSVSPASFNPSLGQSVTISYTLTNMPAQQILASVYNPNNNQFIHEFPVSSGNVGINTFSWNGFGSFLNRNLNLVSDNGTYSVYVYAYAANGAYADGVGSVSIANGGVQPPVLTVSNISASPSTINPSLLETSTISFNLSGSSSNVNANILSANGTVLYTNNLGSRAQGQNQFVWNGYSGNLGRYLNLNADNGSYTIRIDAVDSNGSISSNTGSIFISNGNVSQNLVISNVIASPSTFNASNGGTTSIRFDLSGFSSDVSATITSPGGTVVQSFSRGATTQGQQINLTAWNGYSPNLNRYLNQNGDNGTYSIRVSAVNPNGSVSFGSGSVTISNSTTSSFTLTDLGPSKNAFNPEVETTQFQYSINQDADVRIRVYPQNYNSYNYPQPSSINVSPIRTLLNFTYRSSGTNLTAWNGRDDNGSLVISGLYPYLVEATSRQNSTSAYFWGYVSVNRIGTTLTINDLGPSPYSFNPRRGETTTIRFELSQLDSPSVSIIKNSGSGSGTVVKSLTTPILESSATGRYKYYVTWDGRDSYAQIMPNDTYTYRIRVVASNGLVSNKDNFVRVDDSTGGSTSTGSCAGFSDVPASHPLCQAVQYVVSRGIFLGDSGSNTLRLNDSLNRAETAKVLQSAFGYALEPYDAFRDGDLGFPDLIENSWYMPYMKTFVIRGVMRGFPSGNMRPVQKMKTPELFKVFVEGVFEAPKALARFTLNKNVSVKKAPFLDTPIKTDTKWYLPYAEFARVYSLAPSAPYFYPEREITRGKVIKLIYDSNQRGVVSYGTTNPQARNASDIIFLYGSPSPSYYRSTGSTTYQPGYY